MGGGSSKWQEYQKEGEEQVKQIEKLKITYSEDTLKALTRPTNITEIKVLGESGRLFVDNIEKFQEVTSNFVDFKRDVRILFVGVRRMIGDCKIHNQTLNDKTISPQKATKILSSLNSTVINIVEQMDALVSKIKEMDKTLGIIKIEERSQDLLNYMESKKQKLKDSNIRQDGEGDFVKTVIGSMMVVVGALLSEIPPVGLPIMAGGVAIAEIGLKGERVNTEEIQKLKRLSFVVESVKSQIETMIEVLRPLFKSLYSLLKMQQVSSLSLKNDLKQSLESEFWTVDWELFYNRLLYTWSPICTAYIRYTEQEDESLEKKCCN